MFLSEKRVCNWKGNFGMSIEEKNKIKKFGKKYSYIDKYFT